MINKEVLSKGDTSFLRDKNMQEFAPKVWKDLPIEETPLDADSMNRIEEAIAFSINKVTAQATLNADWTSGDAIGLDFNKVGNLVIANFSASITDVTGMHLFIGTIPEGFRPSQITPFPAVFVTASTTDYEPRILVANPDGTIMIAKNPTVTGAFFCKMLYFAE